MSHLFESIPRMLRLQVFLPCLALTVILMWTFSVLGPRTGDVVRLELVGTAAGAQEIIESWKKEGRLRAAFLNLGLDFLYIPAYSMTLALACV